MDIMTIYYNCNTNVFSDDDGDEYNVSAIISDENSALFKEIGGIYRYDEPEVSIRYEIIFPINDPDRTIYYDVEANLLYDEYGKIMYNIFSLVTPNDLYLFKRNKKTMDVYDQAGGHVELVLPDCLP
jgi:hypothetical protein